MQLSLRNVTEGSMWMILNDSGVGERWPAEGKAQNRNTGVDDRENVKKKKNDVMEWI